MIGICWIFSKAVKIGSYFNNQSIRREFKEIKRTTSTSSGINKNENWIYYEV